MTVIALDGRRRLALALMTASGFAGLGYQVVWTQQCALWLGHEAAAVLAVVAAFFAGLAVGAWGLGARIERSHRAAWWYAGCEAVIGLWGLALLHLMAPASGWLLALTGLEPAPVRQWTVAFVGTFVLLLPATAAMGATLPAIERMAAGRVGQPMGRSLAAWYASNTFGAVAGVLACTFWLVPELGLTRTAAVCVGLNLACALVARLAWPIDPRPERLPAPPRMPDRPARAALARLGATGLLAIGYEVLVVRVISQVAEDTIYTYAVLLAVYLVGTAIGAAGYARRRRRDPDRAARLDDRLLVAMAVACLAGTAGLWAAERLRDASLALFGPGMSAAIGAEAVLALAAFGLPTLAMGALFSRLAEAAGAVGVGFGRALGANTLGAAAAPLLFGVVLAPWIGAGPALVAIVLGYLALTARVGWRRPVVWAPAAAALALGIAAPRLAFVEVPPGGRIVSYREGVTAAVSVVEDAGGILRLRIDNRQQEGTSGTLRVDGRQALLPLLLHPAPHRALFLGLGTGMTASTAAEDPTLEVDAVELLPEVIAASHHFTAVFHDGEPNPRLHLLAADARRYVRVARQRYDVVVADNFHPARSGAGTLYTVEHFRAVRERLADDGLYCQWLPLHQLDLETLRSIVRSFIEVYPEATALLASNSLETPVVGLVGRRDGARFDPAAVRRRVAHNAWPRSPAEFGIEDELALLGSFVAGPASLARYAAAAPLNTDDRPVVVYRAPRMTYVPDSLPRDRLSSLLRELSIRPEELVAGDDSSSAWTDRLAAYWRARDRFVEAGRAVRPMASAAAMLAQVREPLLAVLRTSPDFRPAYDPLLNMAGVLARDDLPAAEALLNDLARVQPERSDAVRMLDDLAGPRRGAAR